LSCFIFDETRVQHVYQLNGLIDPSGSLAHRKTGIPKQSADEGPARTTTGAVNPVPVDVREKLLLPVISVHPVRVPPEDGEAPLPVFIHNVRFEATPPGL
jgi:hypothetical protein